VIAATGPTALWYAARSSGYVSLLLLTAILVLGTLTALRWNTPDWPRFLSQALHRNLSLLVLVFLAIHIVTSVADPFAGIAVLNAVAPFTGSYRPLWLGLGVLSLELLVALVITSLLRQRIPFRIWRALHFAAYACWPLALLHTLGTGSDVRSAWAVVLGLGCVGAVVFALAWRLTSDTPRLPGLTRVVALLVTAAATIALLGFAAAGPLHSGWAKAAGTPAKLLALATGLNDQLTGTVVQNGGIIQVALTDGRDRGLHVTIAVAGNAQTGQLTITENGATVCSTRATVAQDVVATCGHTAVDVSLSQQADGTLAGTMVTRAASQ
jgi:sulfoxide reductase heme-binding subunit YedZ